MGFHHMMLKCNHLYDPLARIPLLVKDPQHIHLPPNDTRLTENIDIAPHSAGCVRFAGAGHDARTVSV